MSRVDGSVGGTTVTISFDRVTDGGTQKKPTDTQQNVPPPTDEITTQSGTPTLSIPISDDSTGLLMAALAIRLKSGEEQLKTSTEDVRFQGDTQKSENQEIGKKLEEQAKQMHKSKKLGGFLKALQWIGVGLTVAIAAVTLNPVAIAGAVAAVSMAVLNETGTMDKMTNAMAESLQKDGMSKTQSMKWAMALTTVIGVSVSLATLGAGATSSATTAAAKAAEMAEKLAAMVPKLAEKAATIVPRLTTATKIASAAVTASQAGVSIDKAVVDKNVSDTTADVADIKAYLSKIKAAMDDETDRIQAIVQSAQDSVSTAVKIMSGVNDSNSDIIRHMA
ncbi:type III secretion system translocon subunit SctE [Hyphomicrobium sp. MC1]|uniref:type III secretion system translocon subunit SctE n=1 Tax=Hyphomicrobium sp. (strain MC1) TaxID=717785 RepID=UPI000213F239|nr:type III secretion system translocon subunit SctE [Hyphomicrobium sp. MC1]CCB66718.1 protein of unknown function [Hyphomicrobium sp. MC1]